VINCVCEWKGEGVSIHVYSLPHLGAPCVPKNGGGGLVVIYVIQIGLKRGTKRAKPAGFSSLNPTGTYGGTGNSSIKWIGKQRLLDVCIL
jgi:hypothetical protein